MEEQIDEIGKEISLAYRFYQGYGYFLSATVAEWLGIESLVNWQYKTILDLCAVDLIRDAVDNLGNQRGRRYLSYFMLHGTYSGRQTVFGDGVNVADIERLVVMINLQKAIAPQFIKDFEVT
ncbi:MULTISPECIES: hypothetical protein [Nostoc]|uniref:hypothetical protein n=1 Tax=Nostoc TaxID=1177 RepID=UPI0018C46D3E|nr:MULTISPECIES: hypothetical protein [Nostoc]MBG1258263.1 hypothetical protein [Nostoc commune BAE]MEA5603802.1 hypothetical protein [Nostoc sp. UHCC 0252]